MPATLLAMSETTTAMVTNLQNLCDDRSTVGAPHAALSVGGRLGGGGRLRCEDCVLETVPGTKPLLVNVSLSRGATCLLDCTSSSLRLAF
jgi:hypothetical protein